MTTKAEWLVLAERCEKAKGPDREIEACLTEALGWKVDRTSNLQWMGEDELPYFTASLDSISALIERELSGWAWRVYGRVSDRSPPQAAIGKLDQHHHDAFCGPVVVAKGATPALALNAAFCRAMAAKAGSP